MPVTVQPLTAGEALPIDIEAAATGGDVAPDFATTNVTLVLDSPADADGVVTRTVFRYRPAGTSHAFFTFNDPTLEFDATSEWTAENMTTSGRWTLYLLVGAAATVQDAVGKMELAVEVPAGGALPVEDPA